MPPPDEDVHNSGELSPSPGLPTVPVLDEQSQQSVEPSPRHELPIMPPSDEPPYQADEASPRYGLPTAPAADKQPHHSDEPSLRPELLTMPHSDEPLHQTDEASSTDGLPTMPASDQPSRQSDEPSPTHGLPTVLPPDETQLGEATTSVCRSTLPASRLHQFVWVEGKARRDGLDTKNVLQPGMQTVPPLQFDHDFLIDISRILLIQPEPTEQADRQGLTPTERDHGQVTEEPQASPATSTHRLDTESLAHPLPPDRYLSKVLLIRIKLANQVDQQVVNSTHTHDRATAAPATSPASRLNLKCLAHVLCLTTNKIYPTAGAMMGRQPVLMVVLGVWSRKEVAERWLFGGMGQMER
ncbi:hypothetical protein BDK51DRAFT_39518 [Blyttiomyces helicus]|uniref:Uncharacterized protein n=1 Tax=Blyttiomyces helicus TaxID=388810 RepID=A0A4P9W7K8_9FUNG|nr:hypothetical protein BDK51DRAFT_39518 [Blyttiomyces helicus]|eukprot:RKO88461.1 hypothetical protein BDK51DRAFT_39518 [Blyttiomyces helicus]